jgi:hypothetical protein
MAVMYFPIGDMVSKLRDRMRALLSASWRSSKFLISPVLMQLSITERKPGDGAFIGSDCLGITTKIIIRPRFSSE